MEQALLPDVSKNTWRIENLSVLKKLKKQNLNSPEACHPVVVYTYNKWSTFYDNIFHFLQPFPPQKPLRRSLDIPPPP